MEDFFLLRYFLAGFFTFVAVFYTALILYKKRTHQPVVSMGPTYSCHWWNHLAFRVFRATIWLVTVVIAFNPAVFKYLLPFGWLLLAPLQWSGAGLLLLGFTLAVGANFSLGKQWRSGIVNNAKHDLIEHGLYSISRNPGYIGVAIAQVGFFLALPSLFSLVCMLVGLAALRKQTQLEEVFLNARYKDRYLAYQNLVPRWL
tara:strand:+ start:1945 stop:2547 length:603 start_codon:yes stop_codon:yes gene_type:complete